MTLVAFGFMLRVLINQSIYFVFAGQILIGLGTPAIMMVKTKFITLWFDENERGLWITFAAMGNPLGLLLGFLMPVFLVDQTLSDRATLKK